MADLETKTTENTTKENEVKDMEKVEMKIDETVNVNANVSVVVNNNPTQVMYLNCGLNADTLGLNINVTVLNKELYKKHATEMKSKYREFKDLVNKRAESLGYVIF